MQEETSNDPAAGSGKKRPSLRLIVVGILGVLALILVFQNTEPVETRILFMSVTMPQAVLLAVTLLLGVVIGLLISFVRRRRR